MSWFDSSFSFAKTALSQAQKSIDKVLDIKDDHSKAVPNSGTVTTVASVPPPTSTSSENVAPTKTHSTPDSPPAKPSPLSTWFSPSQSEEHNKPSKATGHSQSTPVAEKSSTSAFGSTWGGGDSFWGSYFGTPSTSDQGGEGGGGDGGKKTDREGAKEAPKQVSMPRGGGSGRLKSPSSSTAKLESGDKRKTMTSPRLTSPPKSSSTPLPQSRGKVGDGAAATESSSTPTSVRPLLKSGHSATPRTSLKPKQSKKASEKAIKESTGANSSRVGGKVEPDKSTDRGPRFSPTPAIVTVSEGTSVETTDHGSTSTDGVDGTAPSIGQKALPQQEVAESSAQADTGVKYSISRQHSASSNEELINGSSSKDSQPSPTPEHTCTELNSTAQAHQVLVHTPSEAEHTGSVHSPPTVHHDTQKDSTETKTSLAAVQHDSIEQNTLNNVESKVTAGQQNRLSTSNSGTFPADGDSSLESKSVEQDKQVSQAGAITKDQPTHMESTEERDKISKVVEKEGASLQQKETPKPSSDDGDEAPAPTSLTATSDTTQAAEREGQTSTSVKVAQNEGEGGQVANSEHKSDTSSLKKDELESRDQDHPDVDRLKKELADIRQVLEAREQKMVEMSRETISLMEANQTLQEELAEAKRMGQTDVEDLRSEFTRRLATTEKKFQAVAKERDSLRKQLQAQQDEQTQQKRSVGDELTRLVKEKDDQIAQLMEEGEKLSKQELQSNSVIKKLRQKDKQNDQLLAAQRQQIDDLEGKVKILKEQLKKKEENESKYQESLGQLNAIAEQQAKELTSLKSERDELMDKVRSLQANLDSSYKELSELQKANAVTQNAAQEAALSAEQSAREELKNILEQHKVGAQREKEALLMQVDELRVSVSRAEQQAAWREDHMRQELSDMQQRLQEAETRNQELTSSISQATKPLLRQIENLQAAHSTQSVNWDKVEANLTQRLVQTQAQLSQSAEKERSALEKEMTLQSRVKTLETQLSGAKQEKSQLLATLELERAKLQTLEESQQRDSAKTEALRASYQQSMDELRKEKEMLERQLEYERVRLEAESRKACLESQEKERLRTQLASTLSLNRTVSRQSSSGSQSDILEKSLHSGEVAGSVSDMSLHSGRGTAPSASLIEQLQSLLKQKEGELSNSQNLVSSLERSRAAMAEDLANLSAQYETTKKEVEMIPHLQQKLQEVERKHEAMLQMYGEKAEEAEELKLDIQDLKTMYRQQIEELLTKRR